MTGQASTDLFSGRRGPTPYDSYLGTVHNVLENLNGSAPSFDKVEALVRQGYRFTYIRQAPYEAGLPDVTAMRRAGDCKAKALWLADRMNDRSVRFVVGKASRSSQVNHAWLMWKKDGRLWILDPTKSAKPILADSVAPGNYVAFYSYDRSGSFCHSESAGSPQRIAARE